MASMTRKHFKELATPIEQQVKQLTMGLNRGNITEQQHATALACVYTIAVDVAKVCKQDNPLFNNQKFMEACGFLNE